MKEYKLPQKWDVYEFTGLPYFNDWDNGIQANAIYDEKKEKLDNLGKTLHISSIALVVLGLFLLFKNGMIFTPLLMFIVAYQIRNDGWLKRMFVDDVLNEAYLEWRKVLFKHTDMFIKPLAEKLMSGGWYSHRMAQKCFIYGKDGFIYFDTYNSLLVAYDKSNIKDIKRERVHIGSTTQGSANTIGGGYTNKNDVSIGLANTQTYTNTVNEFEWHLDIFTDFLDYPTIFLVLDDTKSIEEFTGKFYALLKP